MSSRRDFDPQMSDDEPNEAGLNRISKVIIGCALTVSKTLGTGFVEKVYENALAHEIRKSGISVAQQHGVIVWYDNVAVGEYAVDLLVQGALIVELKAVAALNAIHHAQCLNYLKVTRLHLCLLLNFGRPRLEIKRFARDL